MSEFPEPGGGTADAAALFSRYLEFYRETVVAQGASLPDAEQRTSPAAVGLDAARAAGAPRLHGAALVRLGLPRRARSTTRGATTRDGRLARAGRRDRRTGRWRCCARWGERTTAVLAAHALDETAPPGPRFDGEPADAGVDLLPRAAGVRPARGAPRRRGRARRGRRRRVRSGSEAGDALAAYAGLLVEVLVLEQVQDGTPILRRAREVQSTWKNSATTCVRVRMIASRPSTSATLAASASIGSALTTSPSAVGAGALRASATQPSQSARACSSSSRWTSSMSSLVHHQRGGGQHLAGGERAHRGLDAGRGVLDRQQHVVADRVLEVLVQAADLGGVRGRQRLLDQQHHVVRRRLAHAHSLVLSGVAQPPRTSARS